MGHTLHSIHWGRPRYVRERYCDVIVTVSRCCSVRERYCNNIATCGGIEFGLGFGQNLKLNWHDIAQRAVASIGNCLAEATLQLMRAAEVPVRCALPRPVAHLLRHCQILLVVLEHLGTGPQILDTHGSQRKVSGREKVATRLEVPAAGDRSASVPIYIVTWTHGNSHRPERFHRRNLL